MAPRKIGHAAAEASPRPAATTPAIVASRVAGVARAHARGYARARSGPGRDDRSAKPAAAVPTVPEPVRPAIDNATVSSVVGAHRPEVLKCFADGKKKDHAMKGTLAVQLAVDTAGKVKHIQVQSTLDNPLVAACVVKSAERVEVPVARRRRGGDGQLSVHDQLTAV